VPADRLAVRDLSAGYGGIEAIHGLTLRVGPGEAVALLGRNGAGKTTTLMTIAGVLPRRSGEVLIDGAPAGSRSFQVSRRGLAVVPQGRRIFPTLTVLENLTLGDRGGDLDLVYELFPVLQERSSARGSSLSGGEQQMLAIGRALMTRPKVLAMDEPSEGLAPQVVRAIGELIHRLRKERDLAILIAEQNIALALEVADRVYVLERGEIVHDAPAAAFREDRESQRRYLGV
jgi:ABC-type branched-subunit amino acid transport system ATPase component